MKKVMTVFSTITIIVLLFCSCNGGNTESNLGSLANTKWENTYNEVCSEYQFNNDASEFVSLDHKMPIYKKYKDKYRKISFSNGGIIYDLETEITVEVQNEELIIKEIINGEVKKHQVFIRVSDVTTTDTNPLV